jgi:TRAP-type C4-dicarboxylate transport system substrate-binding protein
MKSALLILAAASAAHAETVLRMATVAPDGTAWAHEFRSFAGDVERKTQGRVRMKFYFGGIAGPEREVAERIRHGQLDGTIGGPPMCGEVMPSMRVTQIPGMFQSDAEARHVIHRLSARLASEAEQTGFEFLAAAALGATNFFSRRPVHSLGELRRVKVWTWDELQVTVPILREMGLNVVTAPLEQASRLFDRGELDAFWASPVSALAFQWSARATYLMDTHSDYTYGCNLIASRSFFALSKEDQAHLRDATAQLADRVEEVTRQQVRALLGGGFQHQGVTFVPIDEKFRAEFFGAANAARDRIAPRLLPTELLAHVREMLADYRAEHAAGEP